MDKYGDLENGYGVTSGGRDPKSGVRVGWSFGGAPNGQALPLYWDFKRCKPLTQHVD